MNEKKNVFNIYIVYINKKKFRSIFDTLYKYFLESYVLVIRLYAILLINSLN